jgi:hypothetical protein
LGEEVSNSEWKLPYSPLPIRHLQSCGSAGTSPVASTRILVTLNVKLLYDTFFG